MRTIATALSLIALLAAPAAAATGTGGPTTGYLQLDLEDHPGPIQPGGEPGTWTWTLEYRSNVPLPEEVTIHLETQAPGSWDAVVEPDTVTFEATEGFGPGTDRVLTAEGTLQAEPAAHTPAFHAEKARLEAWSDEQTVGETAESATQATLVAGFAPDLTVQTEQQTVHAPEGEEVHVRAGLINHGNGPVQVAYDTIQAPEGCQAEPLEEGIVVDRYQEREAMLHLACDAGADDGQLAVTYTQAYAPDTSLTGPPVTQTWDIDVERSTAVETQAAVLGTTASIGGIPLSAVLALAIVSLLGGARWTRTRAER